MNNYFVRVLLLPLLVLPTLRPGWSAAPSGGPTADVPLVAVPVPFLDNMEAPIRDGLRGFQANVDKLARQPQVTGADLGEAYARLGELYHAHDLYDAAIACYRNALSLRPEDDGSAYFLGILYSARGSLAEAVSCFQQVLEQRPEDLYAMIRLGNVLLELNDFPRAEALFERARSLEPASAEVLSGLGKVALAMNRPKAAIVFFLDALKLQPQASALHYPLALAYRKAGQLETARAWMARRGDGKILVADPRFKKLLHIATTSAVEVTLAVAARMEGFSPRSFLEFAMFHLKEKDGVIDYLLEVIQKKEVGPPPPNPIEMARLHYVVGALLEYRGEIERSFSHFRAAVQKDPSFREPVVKLGAAYNGARRFRETLALVDPLLEVNPDDGEVLLIRANARIGLGIKEQIEAAQVDLLRLEQLEPGLAVVKIRLAMIRLWFGDDVGAVKYFEEVTKLDISAREKAFAFLNLGNLFKARNFFQEALLPYEKAIRLDPESAEAHFQLAGTLGNLQRYSDAAIHYETALRLAPDHQQARQGEVVALVLSKQYAKALSKLEEAHRDFPQNHFLNLMLARMLSAAPTTAMRDGERALKLAKQLYLEKQEIVNAETVAMALAQVGEWEAALSLQRGILETVKKQNDEELARRLSQNLARYEAQQPCCGQTLDQVLLSR